MMQVIFLGLLKSEDFKSFCFEDASKAQKNGDIAYSATPPVTRFEAKLCDSYRIQTYNLLIRSQMLYSVELTSHAFFFIASAKVVSFYQIRKYFRDFFTISFHFLV